MIAGILLICFEVIAFGVFVRTFFEVPGLGRLMVLALYAGSFVAEWLIWGVVWPVRDPGDTHSAVQWLFALGCAFARIVGIGQLFLKSVSSD
jgi:hypothetical protein